MAYTCCCLCTTVILQQAASVAFFNGKVIIKKGMKLLDDIKNFFIPCEDNNFKPDCFFSSFMYWMCFVLLILHVLPIFFFSYLSSDPLFADITKTAIVRLTNDERISVDIGGLERSELLDKAAMLKAQDMFRNQYFAHSSPSGVAPWYWFEQAGYEYEYAGENLAIGFLEPEEVYDGWMNSFTHHQNLLNTNYNEIGVAVLTGIFKGSRTTIVVQLFGTGAEKPVAIDYIPQKEINEKKVVAEYPSEVAGAEIEVGEIVKTSKNTAKHSIINFFIFEYNELLRYLTYYILVLISILLILGLSFSKELRRPEVMLELFFFATVLVLFTMADKQTLIELMPHSFMIS